MRKFDRSIISSLKIFFVTLILLIPVGIALGINDYNEESNNNMSLEPVEKTSKIQSEPIEIVSMRTATSKTYDNGDGSYKAVIWVKPIHYQDNEDNWQETENTNNVPERGSRSRETSNFGASDDGYICGGTGNEDWNMGADQYMFIALENTAIWKTFRSLIKFDISSIPQDSEIEAAKIKLSYFRSEDNDGINIFEGGQTSSMTITANPITKDYKEGTGTWGGTQPPMAYLRFEGS